MLKSFVLKLVSKLCLLAVGLCGNLVLMAGPKTQQCLRVLLYTVSHRRGCVVCFFISSFLLSFFPYLFLQGE